MTQRALVTAGSVLTDNADTCSPFTVDGNKLSQAIPAECVTATATPNSPQIALPLTPSIADQRRKYLESVLVWPADTNSPHGWINLHANAKNDSKPGEPVKNGGKPWVVGWPFKTVDDTLDRINWVSSTDTFFNTWVCMSQQSDMKETTVDGKTKRRAVRNATNATWLKAIWIDIDIKPDDTTGKHYTSLSKALAAIRKFRKKIRLPTPSIVVKSGGGLHVYWVSNRPLTPDEWRPYADGLKALLLREGVLCDAGLTTDIARLLRVPGTKNHKYDPPRLVKLVHFGQAYDFTSALSPLRGVAPIKLTTSAPTVALAVIEPGHEGNFENGPDPAFASLTGADDLAAGIVRRTSVPLDPGPVFEKCEFMRHAKDTQGADYDNPRWHLSVLCTTFLENGNDLAHEVSRGHPTYSFDETQAMYDRKVADRSQGVGYPSCTAIAGVGCKACATCPHFASGKSPLHLTGPVTATVNSSGSAQQVSLWSSTAMNVVFTNVPHRRTLYGYDLVRGEITVLGSPGGFGKSSLAIGMGISIAVGKALLEEKIYGDELSVVLINAEDSTAELRRRVVASCMAHSVLEHELSRLYVAGVDHPGVQALSFLRTNPKNVSELDGSGLATLEQLLEQRRPDLLVLDPLVALCSGGNINDNSSMSLVIRALKGLAIKFDCAILIVHHTRKGGEAGSAEAISGAASIVNLSRRAIMPVGITKDEAVQLGVSSDERWRYFKLIDAKTNLAPRGIDPPIYRLHSIELPNREPPIYPLGDNVQAVVRVQLPVQNSATHQAEKEKIRQAIVDLVDRGKEIDGKLYPYSPSPAGAKNERELLQDAMNAVQAATAPKQWSAGALEVVTKDAISNLQTQQILVPDDVENITSEPGRFRRRRGLRVDHSRISNGSSNAADIKNAA